MKNNESQEMYLETILLLAKKLGNVRAVDICLERNLAKSSVSKALGLLMERQFITVNNNGYITLTETGKARADYVYNKHQIITKVLLSLGAEKTLAEDNACKIEHVITDELFEILKDYANNLEKTTN